MRVMPALRAGTNRVALCCLLLVAALRCGEAPGPTGVRVVTTWSGGLAPDQLEYTMLSAQGARLSEPARRPTTGGGPPLASGVDVVVQVAESQVGQSVGFRVVGLRRGAPVGVGESGRVVLQSGQLVVATVALNAQSTGVADTDGGRDAQVGQAGQDAQGGQDAQVLQGGQDAQDTQGARDAQDAEAGQGGQGPQDAQGAPNGRDGQDGQDAQDTHDAQEVRDFPSWPPPTDAPVAASPDLAPAVDVASGDPVAPPSDAPVVVPPMDAPAPLDVGSTDTEPASDVPASADAPLLDQAPSIDQSPDGPSGPPLKALGEDCTADAECVSDSCVDGVCCQSATCGPCTACNVPDSAGACAPVAAGSADPRGVCVVEAASSCGTDGKCDGAGGCRRYPAGTTCLPAACQVDGVTLTFASACNGAGGCVPGASQPCTPFRCDVAAAACKTTCSSVADCVSPNQCGMTNVCGTLKALGQACTVGSECGSGNCVDGACCSTPTCGSCRACNVTGQAGTCANVPAGVVDPRAMCAVQPASTCGLDGTCDGAGACRLHPLGAECLAGYCTGRTLTRPRTCDGVGACKDRGRVNCDPYNCNPATVACYTSCSTILQCASNRICSNGTCK